MPRRRSRMWGICASNVTAVAHQTRVYLIFEHREVRVVASRGRSCHWLGISQIFPISDDTILRGAMRTKYRRCPDSTADAPQVQYVAPEQLADTVAARQCSAAYRTIPLGRWPHEDRRRTRPFRRASGGVRAFDRRRHGSSRASLPATTKPTLVKAKTAKGIECWFVTCHMLLPALPVDAVLRNGSSATNHGPSCQSESGEPPHSGRSTQPSNVVFDAAHTISGLSDRQRWVEQDLQLLSSKCRFDVPGRRIPPGFAEAGK
jgi:hypothetical protein